MWFKRLMGGDRRRHARGVGRVGGGLFGGCPGAARRRHGGMLGGGLGRVFDHGDLRYVLLHLISEKPRHGYELIKAIEETFGGMYSPSPGVIYPTLTHLEELALVKAEAAGGTKKLYGITPEGAAFLAANRPLIEAILARMELASHACGSAAAPEIVRAMRNLAAALTLRLGRGPLDAEQVRAISGLLDRLAADIETI